MRTKIRQPRADGTQVVSDAPACGSDARIASHLAWVLNDPAISQLGNDELVQLIDALISLPSAVVASRATRVHEGAGAATETMAKNGNVQGFPYTLTGTSAATPSRSVEALPGRRRLR
jgi:hypothetical protein